MKYLIVAMIMLFACNRSVSAETMLLVSGNDDIPFADETLPNRGMATEMVELIVKKMGYTPQVEFQPWKRGYVAAQMGNFVATFPYRRSAEREADFLYSAPFYQLSNRVYVTSNSDLQFNSPQDLIGKKVCSPLGFALPEPLEKLVAAGRIIRETPRDLKLCFAMLNRGRVDFVSINELNGWSTIRSIFGSQNGFKMIGPPVELVGLHLIISKTYPNAEKYLAAFNLALQVLEKQGAMKEIRDRHLRAFYAQLERQ